MKSKANLRQKVDEAAGFQLNLTPGLLNVCMRISHLKVERQCDHKDSPLSSLSLSLSGAFL